MKFKKPTLLISIIAIFLIVGVGSAVIYIGGRGDINLQKGLVAHWKFDGNAKDSTPYQNHGTIYGATTTADRKGQVNRALSFDGVDDYVQATVSQATTTITLWYDSGSGWEHLAKVGSTYYVNGSEATPATFPVYIVGQTVQIGKNEAGSFVSGKIDDVRIYNRALSETDIKRLFESYQ